MKTAYTLTIILALISLACHQQPGREAGSPPATQAQTSDSGKLTQAKAQNALDRWLKIEGYSGASISVVGIRELPQNNSADVDIRIRNLSWNYDNGYVVQKLGCQDCSGVAKFSHYSDGRWVLTSVTNTQAGNWTGISIEAK